MSATSCSLERQRQRIGHQARFQSRARRDLLAREGASRAVAVTHRHRRAIRLEEADVRGRPARDEQLRVETECDRGIRIDDGLDETGAIEFLRDFGELRTDVAAWPNRRGGTSNSWRSKPRSPRCASPVRFERHRQPHARLAARPRKQATAAARTLRSGLVKMTEPAASRNVRRERGSRRPAAIEQQSAAGVARHRECRVDALIDRRGGVEHDGARRARSRLARRALRVRRGRRPIRRPDTRASRSPFDTSSTTRPERRRPEVAASQPGHRPRRARIVDEAERNQRLRRALAVSPLDPARAANASTAACRVQPPRDCREPGVHRSGSGCPRSGSNAAYSSSSMPVGADAERFEIPAIGAVVAARELHENVAAFFEGNTAQRQRHFTTDGWRRILRQPRAPRRTRRLHAAQRAERGDADLRIRVGRGSRSTSRTPSGPSCASSQIARAR